MTHYVAWLYAGSKMMESEYINLEDSEEGKFTAMLLVNALRRGCNLILQRAVA